LEWSIRVSDSMLSLTLILHSKHRTNAPRLTLLAHAGLAGAAARWRGRYLVCFL
jgi:hypothetical protein